MNALDQLDQFARLRQKLAASGLPTDYVARTLRELRDHSDDLTDGDKSSQKSCEVGETLGDLDKLSEFIITEYRRSNWLGRRPVLGFVFFPGLMAFALWNLYFVITLVPVILFSSDLGDYDWATQSIYQTHPLTVALLTLVYFGGKVVPFAFASWVFLRMANRSGRRVRWKVTGIVVMSVLAMFFMRAAIGIPIQPGPDGLHFALEIGTLEHQIYHVGEQFAQGVTPILIGLAAWIFASLRGDTIHTVRGNARRSAA